MSIEIVVFLFGGILLLIGILGGGFELKELKIPKVGWVTRVLASILGIVFISYGISIMNPRPDPNKARIDGDTRGSEKQTQSSIDFTIHDSLTTNAISEQLFIFIDGKNVGTITASQQYPNSMIRVNVPQAGRYSYTVDGNISFMVTGVPVEYRCIGQGMISVEAGKKFILGLSISGDSWLITLLDENK